ncbi:MAG: LVIVD repeat-containing protein [Actinomycetota bacterium]
MRRAFLAALALVIVSGSATATEPAGPNKSHNVKLVKQFAYEGSTEIDVQGDFVYTGELDGVDNRGQDPEKGGMHVFDFSGKKAAETAFLRCPGNDNDVEVVKPGLVVMGYQRNFCALAGTGFMLVDVSNPKKPKILSTLALPSGNAHTVAPYPGGDYVYVSEGGLRNGAGLEYIADISNPRKPKIVGSYKASETGCHDTTFSFVEDRKLAFCSGVGETQIWDVADPLAPAVIGHIVNPAIQFHHSAVASSDGKLLAIDDEAFAAHECRSGRSPHGGVWVYDIGNPAVPIPLGSFSPPRGGDSVIGNYVEWVPSWCLAHYIAWMPGTYYLGVPWNTGGVSVLDFNDPRTPTEVAYYQPEKTAAYAVEWHEGRFLVSDMYQGLLVLEVGGL